MKRDLTPTIMAALMFVLMVCLLPCRNLWMGDGYTVKSMFTSSSLTLLEMIAIKDGFFFISPLAVIGLKVLGLGLSYLCGLIYGVYVWKLSQIKPGYAVLFVLPVAQMFAGYWEVYAVAVAFSVAAYYYYLTADTPAMLYMAGLAFLGHFIIGLPVVSLVVYGTWRAGKPLVAGMVALSVAGYVLFMATTFTRPQVSSSLFGYYGLLSVPRLIDVGMVLGFFCGWMLINGVRPRFSTPLLAPALLSVAMIWGMTSHLGVLRDWDLFSVIAVPLAVWYVHTVQTIRPRAFIVAGGITFAFMMFNTSNPQNMMIGYMTHAAPQYDQRFMDGHVMAVTQFIYRKECHGTDRLFTMEGD